MDYHYRYDDLSEKLVEVLPELRGWYEALLRDWGDERPGQYISYDLLDHYLAILLDSGESEDKLGQIFQFVEELAKHPDAEVRELAMVGPLEFVIRHGWIAKAWPYMGEASRMGIFRDGLLFICPRKEERAEYRRRWEEEVAEAGGAANLGWEEMIAIRSRVNEQFAMKPDHAYNPYAGIDEERFRARYREELAKLGPIQGKATRLPVVGDMYEFHTWTNNIRDMREGLLKECLKPQ